ncbi:MAG: endopeptidase La [Clostridia bacterium]|nr:endopeptidase La [Clostridia bacterium]
MSTYIEKTKAMTLPLLPLRGAVAFPSIPFAIEVNRPEEVAALETAKEHGGAIFLLAFKSPDDDEEVCERTLYRVGVMAKIEKFTRHAGGIVRANLDCLCRGEVVSISDSPVLTARVICKTVKVEAEADEEQTLRAAVLKKLDQFIGQIPEFNKDIEKTIKSADDPGQLADFIAGSLLLRLEHKQQILDEFDPIERLHLLSEILDDELLLLAEEINIHKKTRERMEANQRDYYLREQMKVIQSELGEGGEDDDIAEYLFKISRIKEMPQEIRDKLVKEVRKLEKLPFASPESNVIRGYLDTCLELPFGKKTADRADVAAARKILDRDHDGMEKVKERILEYIAVRARTEGIRNQILCLVGAPGVGKTSVASSIAAALKRKFVRVSLGGVRDEADIRGHRKTYVAAMPGRIIDAIVKAESENPLILLDEIDKLTRDAHGDPSAALLEVLDPDQNKNFRDHFLEFPWDLSDCIFIATANTLDTVPKPLLDRMEIIELPSYSRSEKLSIAKNHLFPKQLARHGLSKKQFKLSDDTLLEVIDGYTREAGVRNLERELASLCRKAAMRLADDPDATSVKINKKNLAEFLGPRKVLDDKLPETDTVGLVNGLAYTEAGGDLLQVEALPLPGSGKLQLTGSLGKVMTESAEIARSVVRARAEQYGIDPDFHKNTDLHIHFPEGAIPKDGPSAGVTMVTVMISALAGIPVRRDVAMTGEVSLRGRVIAIGGLREKSMAAYKAGVKTVLVPADNRPDYEKLDAFLKEGMEYVFCDTVEDVLKVALIRSAEKTVSADEKSVTVSDGKPLPLPVDHKRGGRRRESQYH